VLLFILSMNLRENFPLNPKCLLTPALFLLFGEERETAVATFAVHGPDARPLLEVEAPHEPEATMQKKAHAKFATATKERQRTYFPTELRLHS
jgi:hypothetical protein